MSYCCFSAPLVSTMSQRLHALRHLPGRARVPTMKPSLRAHSPAEAQLSQSSCVHTHTHTHTYERHTSSVHSTAPHSASAAKETPLLPACVCVWTHILILAPVNVAWLGLGVLLDGLYWLIAHGVVTHMNPVYTHTHTHTHRGRELQKHTFMLAYVCAVGAT